MAKPDQVDQEKVTTETLSDADVSQPDAVQAPKSTVPKITGGWWAVVAILAFFATLGLVAAGFAVQRSVSSTDDVRFAGRGMMRQDFDSDFSGQRGGRLRGGMMGQGDLESDTNTNASRVNGVVIAISGSTITVAGNGQTTKVVVNDSTTYMGDDKPAAVNDTIMAVGTKDGDTLIASQVILQRQ